MADKLQGLIDAAYDDRALLERPEYREAVEQVIEGLDRGELRAASPGSFSGPSVEPTGPFSGPSVEPTGPFSGPSVEPTGPDGWTVNAWVMRGILLYFGIRALEIHEVGPFQFHDKIPLKRRLDAAKVRVVPPGTVRYGAHLEPGVVVMPGYVNIGAYVGSGTMVDTWATVGSCAQIGKDCHLSGGVGIGGVLEPPGARPVIVEDGCFIGSRAIVVEGVHVESEAVIGAGVVLTASTLILDVSGSEPVEHRGRVPARSVVIPGMRPKRFAAGEYAVPCALIIGTRKAGTDRKVSLNAALRDFGVSV